MIRDRQHLHRTRLVATAALIVTVLAALLPVAVANAASPYILTFTTQPGSSSGPGTALGSQPVVNVTDSGSVPQAGVAVTISIDPGTGNTSGTLSCTSSLTVSTDASGNATFSGCSITSPEANMNSWQRNRWAPLSTVPGSTFPLAPPTSSSSPRARRAQASARPFRPARQWQSRRPECRRYQRPDSVIQLAPGAFNPGGGV